MRIKLKASKHFIRCKERNAMYFSIKDEILDSMYISNREHVEIKNEVIGNLNGLWIFIGFIAGILLVMYGYIALQLFRLGGK
jgi:hypothetical protein